MKEWTVAKKIEGWPREFLARPRAFATLSTIAADGAPRSAVIWYTLRDEDILVNSAVGRAWPTNLLRDPRYSLSLENGYEWLGARGTAEAITDQAAAQADIAAMARRYYEPTKAERIITETFKRQERISFRLHVEAFAEHPDV
jgi:PPOX class probable F420-dependent enzyme